MLTQPATAPLNLCELTLTLRELSAPRAAPRELPVTLHQSPRPSPHRVQHKGKEDRGTTRKDNWTHVSELMGLTFKLRPGEGLPSLPGFRVCASVCRRVYTHMHSIYVVLKLRHSKADTERRERLGCVPESKIP